MGGFGLLIVFPLHGQDLQTKPTPLSAYLDLRPAPTGAAPQNAPAWVDAFEFIPAADAVADVDTEAAPPLVLSEAHLAASEAVLITAIHAQHEAMAVYRLRLRRPAGATEYLQARVFFDDTTLKTRPRLTVWNELGTEMMRSTPLGQGLGLPSSESLLVPMTGVDYLEIESPGDGSHVRGVFLTWLDKTEVLQSKDFATAAMVVEPFGNLVPTHAPQSDTYLFGAVTAPLQDAKPLLLRPEGNSTGIFQFELEQRPLMAVVTYEILGATIGAEPAMSVNGRSLGPAGLHLPDLADPGFRGESNEGKTQMDFRYTGWLHAQTVVPGDALVAGLNNLSVALSNGSKAVAIRAVSIQLKYNWDKLDYILSPAQVPHETH